MTAGIPTIDELELPQIYEDLVNEPRGLIVVSGPTDSGTTTTLAAMVQHYLNVSEGHHIITIEDPIEYIHTSIKSTITQRQLALRLVDKYGCWVSESTVYRILRREGLVKRAEVKGFVAGKEYHRKTRRPNEMWATDCSYLRVVGWGYYYLVTVMDDFSRYILGWELKRDMTASSLIDVVQQAVDSTGMDKVPIKDRTSLLSDNGSGYVSQAFGDYLRLVGIKHILALALSSSNQW